MISAGKSLKVTTTATATDKNGSTTTDSPNIAQATRVGIIEAKTIKVGTSGTDTKGTMTGATYVAATDANKIHQEYLVAAPAETDYNLEGLKALGYTGGSEYKDKTDSKLGTELYSTNGLTITSPKNGSDEYTTTDGAFAYGSLSIYVWIDGTDKSCTNAIYWQQEIYDNKFGKNKEI